MRTILMTVAVLAIGAGSTRAQSFEVASVLPAEGVGGIDARFYPNRFVGTYLTLEQLIGQAWSIDAREIAGGPDWIRIARFNVTATTGEESTPPDRVRAMLQALLTDRFQLQLERATQTGTVYSLTAPRVRDLKSPADPQTRPLILTQNTSGPAGLAYRYDGRNATMGMLARTLSQHLRAPVSDQTNVSGSYDFSISYTYDEPFNGLAPDPNLPTIFTAVESLGLKLVAGRGPIPVWAVKRVARPTAN
jgi:uncharacterized protein (TIGR03435 family)